MENRVSPGSQALGIRGKFTHQNSGHGQGPSVLMSPISHNHHRYMTVFGPSGLGEIRKAGSLKGKSQNRPKIEKSALFWRREELNQGKRLGEPRTYTWPFVPVLASSLGSRFDSRPDLLPGLAAVPSLRRRSLPFGPAGSFSVYDTARPLSRQASKPPLKVNPRRKGDECALP